MNGLFWKVIVDDKTVLFSDFEDAMEYLIINDIYDFGEEIPHSAITLVDVTSSDVKRLEDFQDELWCICDS